MTYFGPDGDESLDGVKLTSADWSSVSFGIWRCIHQSGVLDETYRRNRDQFKAHNKPFCAYVWLDAMDPIRKANYAAAAINDTSIPVMIDWEDKTCPWNRVPVFANAMRARGYKVPLLYTGKGFHEDMGSPTLTGHGFELVIARYGDEDSDYGKYERDARYNYMMSKYSVWNWNLGGLLPVMWQFGSRIHWGNHYCDINAIRDPAVITRCFKHWSAVSPPPPPPPTSNPTPPGTPAFRLGATNATTVVSGWPNGRVSALQTVMGGLTVDGQFGSKTDVKLRELQKTGGLVADGWYGPKTEAKFKEWRGI